MGIRTLAHEVGEVTLQFTMYPTSERLPDQEPGTLGL